MAFLLDKVKVFMQGQGIQPSAQAWLVACSGGPDSVALASALRTLGYPLALAHVNYGLRGADAAADAAWVETLAQRWDLPFHLRMASLEDASTASVQMQARDIRYAFFEQLLDEHGYLGCAMAHHADDQAETLLLSLLRSQEASLWHGIPAQRDRYLRPLLGCTRAEIEQYLAEQDLAYRVDRSNEKPDYLRNQVRLRVIPALEPLHPTPGAQLRERYAWYQQQHSCLRAVLADYLPDPAAELDWQAFVARFGQDHLPVLVAEAVAQWGLSGNWQQQAIRLIDSEVGHYLDTPLGRLWRTRPGLALHRSAIPPTPQRISRGELPQELTWGGWRVQLRCPWLQPPVFGQPNQFYLDADRVAWPLTLRSWQKGDRMQPLGLRGSKLLSDIFIDEKYPPQAKAQALVLADEQGPVALSDFRLAERTKITEQTQTVLHLSLQHEQRSKR